MEDLIQTGSAQGYRWLPKRALERVHHAPAAGRPSVVQSSSRLARAEADGDAARRRRQAHLVARLASNDGLCGRGRASDRFRGRGRAGQRITTRRRAWAEADGDTARRRRQAQVVPRHTSGRACRRVSGCGGARDAEQDVDRGS